jgi:hypothetical protein
MMRLFGVDRYKLGDMDFGPQLSTPLGNLERQYLTASRTNLLRQEPVSYRHLSRNAVLCQWVAPGCIVEELLVAFTPPTLAPLHEINCKALVVRLEALVSGQTFDAELFWMPGYRWVEGIGEPGEGLEARSWFDNAWNVTVGTEDSEYLAARCRCGNWMPRRFATYLAAHPEDALQVKHQSFSIHLPELESGERCQFQFVIASAPRQEGDSTLWFAVDQPPDVLLAAGDCR